MLVPCGNAVDLNRNIRQSAAVSATSPQGYFPRSTSADGLRPISARAAFDSVLSMCAELPILGLGCCARDPNEMGVRCLGRKGR